MMRKIMAGWMAGLAVGLLLAGACQAHAQTAGMVVESRGIVSFDDMAGAAPDAAGRGTADGGVLERIWNWITRQMAAYIRYDVELLKVTYQTTTAGGEPITVTGLIVMPVSDHHTNALPLLAFQHPTQVERRFSPSMFTNAAEVFTDPQFSAPVSALIGMSGYVVVLADYPGLGDNTNAHPYCHLSLANGVIDIVRAGLALLPENPRYPAWNDELYLMGFSEGGYATMATARQLQLQPVTGLAVSAVAALDGPYSLSDTMRNVMVYSDTNYTAPYFLPYVINGYDSVYAAEHPEFVFTNAVLDSVPADPAFAANLRRMVMDGTNTASEINHQMFKAEPYTGPASILTPAFRAGMADTNSVVCDILRENDGFRGWAPAMPMVLMHNVYDDYVPYGNSTNAWRAFQTAGAPHVTLDPFGMGLDGLLIALLKQAAGSTHAASAPFAYIRGFQWLDRYAHPARQSERDPWGDVDGDGRSDPVLYNAQEGRFMAQLSGAGHAGQSVALGGPGCMARLADFDGDGKADPCVYEPATGNWLIMSSFFGYQSMPLNLLAPGDHAVPMDFSGNGMADLAVYDSALGLWTVLCLMDGTYSIKQLGGAGVLPVPADYDGDGRADHAVCMPLTGGWMLALSGTAVNMPLQLGYAGCLPAVGDYDGDGKADPGVCWPATGNWLARLSDTGANVTLAGLGGPGFVPVIADYDGDGKADPAVYSESAGEWRAKLSGAGYHEYRLAFGGPGWQPAR